MTDKEKLIKAKEFMDANDFGKSLDLLLTISDENHTDKFIEMRYLFLANCYLKTKNYDYSLECCDEVLKLNSSNELASQLKYLTYFQLKDYDNALLEIITFLKYNPAELYKITLGELLEDIKTGNISDDAVVNAIKILAEENGVL